MKGFFKWLVVLAVVGSILSGCYDVKEIESNALVIALGIDFEPDKKEYTVTAAVPVGEGKKEAKGEKSVKKASAPSIKDALGRLDAETSKSMYFGQVKIIVLGNKVLSNKDAFLGCVDFLERSNDISRNTLILAADGDEESTAAKIIEGETQDEPISGLYVTTFYKNNKGSIDTTFRLILEEMVIDLRNSGAVIIPKIDYDDEEKTYRLEGASIVKDFQKAGKLDKDAMRGFLLAKDIPAHQAISVAETNVSYQLNKNKRKLNFYEEGGKLHCLVNVSIEGTVQEFTFMGSLVVDKEGSERIITALQKQLSEETSNTYGYIYYDMKIDGLKLIDHLRKFDYPLYQKYEGITPEEIAISTTAQVKIKDSNFMNKFSFFWENL